MWSIGLEYHSEFVGPAFGLGLAAAGLYGLLSVSLVLTYRVSRTIGFIQGGLAVLGAYLYWWLTYDTGATTGFGIDQPRMGSVPGLVIVALVGALLGFVYGVSVTSRRLAKWPRLTMTIFSLAWLLGLVATALTFMSPQESRLPSAFGMKTFSFFGGVVTIHQLVTLCILVGVMASLAFVLVRTQMGINIRAIADDVEASRFVGVPLSSAGTGVYVFAGALSAFAGALLTSTAGVTVFALLVVFLRALEVSILGGFTSFGLALAGCALLGIGESMLTAGTFGRMSGGTVEVIIMSVLFLLVFLINRLRPIKMLEAQGL
jgi:branched-chain amino acid transport system permease protein